MKLLPDSSGHLPPIKGDEAEGGEEQENACEGMSVLIVSYLDKSNELHL